MKRLLLLLCVVLLHSYVNAQVDISSTGTITIDFDNTLSDVNNGAFDGSGITTSPATGQLNSNAFSITGASDGTLSFGGSGTSGDYARGTSTGGTSTGGVYSFNTASSGTDYCIGVQPGGSDFTPGAIIVKLTNNTSDGIYFTVGYDILTYNDQNRSASVKFAHSADNSTYTDESSLDYTSTAAKDNSPAWVTTNKSIDLTVTVAAGESYYLRWTFDDDSGSGSRDEIGIDNIAITSSQVSSASTVVNNGGESTTLSSINNTTPITTSSDGMKIWELQFNDGDGNTNDDDSKPTIVTQIILTAGTDNEPVNWISYIKKTAIFNGSTRLDVGDVYSDSLVFNLSTTEGKISDNGSEVFDIYITLEESVTDLEHFQFELEYANLTVEDASSSSQIPSFSAISTDVSKNEIAVLPTALNYIQQPSSSIVNADMTPAVEVEFVDANGNRDLSGNSSAQLRVTSSGTMSSTPLTSTLNSSGIASFSTINHTSTGSGLELTVEDFNDFMGIGSNTTLVSSSFNIEDQDSLIIVEITDPSNDFTGRYIELYNASSSTIDFSSTTYYLGIQFNGGSSLNNTQLTGSVPPKGIYTIARDEDDFNSLYSLTSDQEYSFMGNGDDVVILYKGGNSSSGTITDIYGVFDEDGTGQSWEYTDSKVVRNTSVMQANSTWTSSEWTITSSQNTSAMTPRRLEDEMRYHSNDGWAGSTPSGSTGGDDLVVQSGTATISADGSCNSITVFTGTNLEVDASQTLSVTNDITVEGTGTFTVNDNGSLYQTSSSATNSGDVTLKRSGWGNAVRYNMWSSPVSSAGLTTVFPNANPCDMFVFDADQQTWKYDFTPNAGSYTCNGNGGVQFAAHHVTTTGSADGVMDVGTGYFVPGNTTSSSYDFTGVPNNGTYNVNVYAQSNPGGVNWSEDDWNLIGNPYPCAIDLSNSNSNSFLNVNTSKITGDFYFWIDDADTANYNEDADYATFNSAGGTTANGTTANRYVPSGRAFWVKVLGDNTLTFNNDMKATGNNSTWYKTDDIQRLSLTLEQENKTQNILIAMEANASLGYDMGWDSPTLSSGRSLGMASVIDSGYFAIQTVPFPEQRNPITIPLIISSTVEKTHTLVMDNRSNIADNIDVILFDVHHVKKHNLKHADVVLALDSGNYENRFYVQFSLKDEVTDSSDVVSINETNISDVNAFYFENQIWISGQQENDFEEMTLFDIMGRKVWTESISGTESVVYLETDLVSGSYILRLNGTKEETLRIQVP